MEDLLRLENLSVHYKTVRGEVRALDGVSLNLPAGETLGVVGETGCGKSTLAKAVLGVLPPGTRVTGHVRFRGTDLLTMEEEALRELRGTGLALIFQDPMTRLIPLMTIDGHFVEMIRAHEEVTEEEARNRARVALTSVGIAESRMRNFPHEFSGGMRQRIMIALALVLRPSLLVADEPTTSLDVIVEAGILEILEELKRTHGMSLLLITHNLGIVAETCDRIAVLYAGRLVEIGSAREIFARPIHPYTRGLLRSVIHLDTKELSSIKGSPPDLYEPPPGCRFHPRCPYAQDICRRALPPLEEFRPGHLAACHFGRDFL